MNAVAKDVRTNTTTKQDGPDWCDLLNEALTQPGTVSSAYSLFHSYSLGNSIWVWCQLLQRGIEPGPVATFRQWQEMGRQVRKGEKALAMCMPMMVRRRDRAPNEDEPGEFVDRMFFATRRNWFVVSQTDAIEGAEQRAHEAGEPQQFDLARAVAALGLSRVPFEMMDGNCQGYARPNAKEFAVSPIAADTFKTSIHEIAHCLLHTDSAEFIDGEIPGRGLKEVEAEGTAYIVAATLGHTGRLDTMRGYIQGWLSRSPEPFTDKNARRIFAAANKILKAGTTRQEGQTP